MDVHGAGAQRSDPKAGDPTRFPYGRGPQGDVIRIYNYVRCVRGGTAEPRTTGPKVEMKQTTRRQQNRKMSQPPAGADFIQRLDKNGDGKISRSELNEKSNN
jgi:hypothetical protein